MTAERTSSEFRAVGRLRRRHLEHAFRIVRNRADAEDELQNAYLAAWEHRAEFDVRSGFQYWFGRILTNCCLMRLRAQKRKREMSLEQLMEHGGFQPRAEDQRAQREMIDRVRSALRSLPPLYRNVLILRYLENMPMRAAGARLGIGIPTLKSRSRRAYAELRARCGGRLRNS